MITVNSSKTLGELANWSMFLVFILIQSSLELAAIAILLEHEIPQMGLELQSHAAHIIHSVRTRDIHPHPTSTHTSARSPTIAGLPTFGRRLPFRCLASGGKFTRSTTNNN